MKRTLALIAALLLTACETAPAGYSPPPLSFENATSAPIALNVAKVDVLDRYESPLKRPNVEQEFPVMPQKALTQWANQRIRAVGTAGTLEVTIREASVRETPLKKTQGVKGLFTDDQDARYDARIVVTYRLFDGTSNASRAQADVEVTRFMTINEKATVVERQKRYHQMLDLMLTDVERETNNRMRQYFAAYLR